MLFNRTRHTTDTIEARLSTCGQRCTGVIDCAVYWLALLSRTKEDLQLNVDALMTGC